MLLIYLLLMFVATGLSQPKDEPVRVELPVYVSADVQVEPPASENHPQLKADEDNTVAGQLSTKLGLKSTVLGKDLEPKIPAIDTLYHGDGLFTAPVVALEGALLENEGLGSKVLSVKEKVQGFVSGIIQATPIVDTIEESEKYGNMGDTFSIVGQAFIKTAENISNMVNSVIGFPGTILGTIARGATAKLNNIGGALIGL